MYAFRHRKLFKSLNSTATESKANVTASLKSFGPKTLSSPACNSAFVTEGIGSSPSTSTYTVTSNTGSSLAFSTVTEVESAAVIITAFGTLRLSRYPEIEKAAIAQLNPLSVPTTANHAGTLPQSTTLPSLTARNADSKGIRYFDHILACFQNIRNQNYSGMEPAKISFEKRRSSKTLGFGKCDSSGVFILENLPGRQAPDKFVNGPFRCKTVCRFLNSAVYQIFRNAKILLRLALLRSLEAGWRSMLQNVICTFHPNLEHHILRKVFGQELDFIPPNAGVTMQALKCMTSACIGYICSPFSAHVIDIRIEHAICSRDLDLFGELAYPLRCDHSQGAAVVAAPVNQCQIRALLDQSQELIFSPYGRTQSNPPSVAGNC